MILVGSTISTVRPARLVKPPARLPTTASMHLTHAMMTVSLGALVAVARPALADPVVVELFQSEGCSSCPPADEVLKNLAKRPEVLALSFGVTYWDSLGWKDTFAQQAFTQRHYDYAARAGTSGVWTPQFIVDGRILPSGAELSSALSPRQAESAPTLTFSENRLTISGGSSASSATVWLVEFDPRLQQVAVRAGENANRTLSHRNVVRHLVALGHWVGERASFALGPVSPGLERAVLVQIDGVGPIIAAKRLN